MKFLQLALHSASFQYALDSSGYASTDLVQVVLGLPGFLFSPVDSRIRPVL